MTRKKRARQAHDDGGAPPSPSSPPPPSSSSPPPPPPPAKRTFRVRAPKEEDDGGKSGGGGGGINEGECENDDDAPEGRRRRRNRRYWLMKAEPESRIVKGVDVKFSIDDLMVCREPAAWDGVRNYGARNNLRSMQKGDLAFFYHSNCKRPGIVGVMEVVREASVDETAFDKTHPYYDPASNPDAPRWFAVHVEFRRKFAHELGLAELKGYASAQLKELPLLKAARLSVSEVPEECWGFILGLEGGGSGVGGGE